MWNIVSEPFWNAMFIFPTQQKDVYKLVKVNTDEEKAKFDFTNDIYRFTTTYNKNYIDII